MCPQPSTEGQPRPRGPETGVSFLWALPPGRGLLQLSPWQPPPPRQAQPSQEDQAGRRVLLWAERLCPPRIHEALTPSGIVFGIRRWGLWEITRLRWGQEGGTLVTVQCPCKRDREILFSSSAHTEDGSREDTVRRRRLCTRKGVLPGTCPCWHLASDLQPPGRGRSVCSSSSQPGVLCCSCQN